MQHVLFVDPFWNSKVEPPDLELASLLAHLDKREFAAQLIDFCHPVASPISRRQDFLNHENTFFDKILTKAQYSDIVYITCRFGLYSRTLKISEIVKDKFPKKIIIVGGPFITYLGLYEGEYDTPFKDSEYIDILIYSESELRINSIFKFCRNDQELKKIPNICFKDRYNNIYRNIQKNNFADLNYLKKPDYSYFNLKYYYLKILNIFGARGCSVNCEFCGESFLWYNVYREKTAQKIIEEIINNIKLYNITHFSIYDPAFLMHTQLKEFINLLIEHELDISWGCMGRAADIKNLGNDLELLAQSGFKVINMPLQIIYDTYCFNYHDNLYGQTENQAKDSIKKLKKAGIRTHLGIHIGWPDKPLEYTEKLINFALDSGGELIFWHVFKPNFLNLGENIKIDKSVPIGHWKDQEINVPDSLLGDILPNASANVLTDEHTLIRAILHVEPFPRLKQIHYGNFTLYDLYTLLRKYLLPNLKAFNEDLHYQILSESK